MYAKGELMCRSLWLRLFMLVMLLLPSSFGGCQCDTSDGPAEETGEAIDESIEEAGDAVEEATD